MKKLTKALLIVTAVVLFYSCAKTGQIQVKNDTELMMENVRWGDVLISERILAGETSKPKTIKIEKNASNANAIYFESVNEDYYIYAKTEYHHTISKDNLKTVRINQKSDLTINTKPR